MAATGYRSKLLFDRLMIPMPFTNDSQLAQRVAVASQIDIESLWKNTFWPISLVSQGRNHKRDTLYV